MPDEPPLYLRLLRAHYAWKLRRRAEWARDMLGRALHRPPTDDELAEALERPVSALPIILSAPDPRYHSLPGDPRAAQRARKLKKRNLLDDAKGLKSDAPEGTHTKER